MDIKTCLPIILVCILIGAVSGGIAAFLVIDYKMNDKNEMIREYYSTEDAVHSSPHSIRKAFDKDQISFVLVDLRSEQEYEKEHIVTAVNIPAYKDPDTSAYGDVERIVNSFKELKESNPEKDIIVYCYSMPCMTGRKIGKMLSEHGIYVKHLNIGWNEWRYHWTLWNHEHEWNLTNADDYVISGKEPGISKTNNSTACSILNEFGC